MYILWSKQEFDDKYILFAKNTFDELKQSFEDFCKKNEEEYDLNTELKEKELDSFSLYSHNDDFNFSNIEDVDANKTIYIYTFNEDGKGGNHHNEIYFEISNNKKELLKRATEYFITESEKTKTKDINEMLDNLKTIVHKVDIIGFNNYYISYLFKFFNKINFITISVSSTSSVGKLQCHL